jgi:hypothetical protein
VKIILATALPLKELVSGIKNSLQLVVGSKNLKIRDTKDKLKDAAKNLLDSQISFTTKELHAEVSTGFASISERTVAKYLKNYLTELDLEKVPCSYPYAYQRKV